jgi:hypothetical protein
MGDPRADAERAVELFAEVVGETIGGIFRWAFGLSASQCASAEQRKAERYARAAERRTRQRANEWFDQVDQEKTRGDARFASPEEARAGLRGRGGPPNPLDDRRF